MPQNPASDGGVPVFTVADLLMLEPSGCALDANTPLIYIRREAHDRRSRPCIRAKPCEKGPPRMCFRRRDLSTSPFPGLAEGETGLQSCYVWHSAITYTLHVILSSPSKAMSSESEIEKAELEHLERVQPEAKPAMDTEPTRRLTVLGTENQDPDVKQHISLRSWLILALCVLGQMQNIFILSVLSSSIALSIRADSPNILNAALLPPPTPTPSLVLSVLRPANGSGSSRPSVFPPSPPVRSWPRSPTSTAGGGSSSSVMPCLLLEP